MEFLVGITPREYQQKIFETCVKKNCLVVLPTGLGKEIHKFAKEQKKEFKRRK